MRTVTECESDELPRPEDDDERTAPDREILPRTLYWWRVPEKPGIGEQMLVFTVVWLVAIVALVVILNAMATASG